MPQWVKEPREKVQVITWLQKPYVARCLAVLMRDADQRRGSANPVKEVKEFHKGVSGSRL